MSNLRKRILCAVAIMALGFESFAQAYYMHEAAEDAGYRDSGGDFLEVLQWIIFLGIGLVFIVGFGIGWIKEQFESSSEIPSIPQVDPDKIVLKGDFHNGWARFKTQSGKYGFINANGTILKCTSPNDLHFDGIKYFTEAEEFKHEIAIVRLGHCQYALINILGQNINTRCENARNETYIKELENGLIYYKRRNHQHHDIFKYECYLYNRKGRLVYDGILEEITINKDGFIEIRNDEGIAKINVHGRFITPFCRQDIFLNGSLYKVFSIKGFCGVFDNSKQKMILPYGKYGNLLYILDQNVFLCSHYRFTGYERGWSIVDIEGKVLFSINADFVEILNEKCLLITQSNGSGNRLKGVYSFYGKSVVPILYDEILSSESGTEFLAKSVNPNDSFDYKFTLYNNNGEMTRFEEYDYVNYYTMKGIASYEGVIRGFGVYSCDDEYKRRIDCPAFIELTKRRDDNVRVSIVNMRNEVIVPANYIFINELRDSNGHLIGFQASKPKGGDYVKLDLEGNVTDEGNTIRDHEIDEYLELMLPGYRSEINRAIEEDAWFSNLEDVEDDKYDNDVLF